MKNEGFFLLSKFDPRIVGRDSIRVIAIHHLPLLLAAVWIIVMITRMIQVLRRHLIITGHVRCVASCAPRIMLCRCGAVVRVTEKLFRTRRHETGRHLIWFWIEAWIEWRLGICHRIIDSIRDCWRRWQTSLIISLSFQSVINNVAVNSWLTLTEMWDLGIMLGVWGGVVSDRYM